MKPTPEIIRQLPKVLLHDHLDGGLRIGTIIELAEKENYRLPSEDPTELLDWIHRGARQGDLKLYLETFKIIYAILQTKEALERTAYEMMLDLKEDNVAYVETRFAPFFHTQKGLTHDEIMEAVLRGLQMGERETGVKFGLIICSMRNTDWSLPMAELAIKFREKGAVAFDLAGEEAGYPPKKHVEAFHYCQRENFNITIHAGEAFGARSIWQALQWCGAHRIGHGTRLIEDFVIEDGEVRGLGTLAQYMLDKRIPLECCLSSNIHTGAAESFATHPFRYFFKKRFRVTLNTDNRLMSDTSMSKELGIAAREYGLTIRDMEILTLNAMKSAFLHYDERCDIIYNVIKPAYAKYRKPEEYIGNPKSQIPNPKS
ncbi:MAG: adenosine deaminase [Candidatus Aureabacteria bacterium]|nr:adenosine deaminase [Candidatus Auribacterota bacterium]